MVRSARRFAVFAFLGWLFAVPAIADPIGVTSGSSTFLYWDGSFTSAHLGGTGLAAGFEGTGGGLAFLESGTRSLDGSFVAQVFGGVHPWHVTVNGTAYEAFIDARMEFTTERFVVPPGERGDTILFSTPFTMTGTLRGTTAAFGQGSVLFDELLSGVGMASANAGGVDSNLFRIPGVLYEFSAASDVSATPEPATLLLMGTGLAGVWIRRRRSRL